MPRRNEAPRSAPERRARRRLDPLRPRRRQGPRRNGLGLGQFRSPIGQRHDLRHGRLRAVVLRLGLLRIDEAHAGAGPAVGDRRRERETLDAVHGFEAGCDERMPIAGRRDFARLPAADIEPVLGARHRNVEETAIFLGAKTLRRLLRRIERRRRAIVTGRPQRQPVPGPQHARHLGRHLQRVGQEDDRRLQALGAVHRQDAHLVAPALVEIALHFDVARREPLQKALERGSVPPLIGERCRQQLVERIGGVGTEPRHEFSPAAARAQNFGDELVRRREIGAAQKIAEERVGARENLVLGRAPAQRRPKCRPVAAIVREREQAILVEPAERTLEHGGESEIVLRQQQEAAAAPSCPRPRAARRGACGRRPRPRSPRSLSARTSAGDEARAAAHQHHHVAGGDPAVARGKRSPRSIQPLMVDGDRLGQAQLGHARAMLLDGRLPRRAAAAARAARPAATARRILPRPRDARGAGSARRATRRPGPPGARTRHRPRRAQPRSSGTTRRAARARIVPARRARARRNDRASARMRRGRRAES